MDASSHLQSLLKLSSKQQVVDLCNQAFLHRKNSPAHLPLQFVQSTSKLLGLPVSETRQCIQTLSELLKSAIFAGSSDPKEILALFPDDVQKNLKELITKVILDNMNTWKTDAIAGQVSLPRLVDFDWRVDTKTSSDSVARMAVPTCILNVELRERPSQVGQAPQTTQETVELSKETLDTMLDGLGRIRDQLDSVARR